MATYTSHRLIMEKSGNCKSLLSHWRYLNFVFREMFIEWCSTFQMTFILIAYFDWLLGPQKCQIFQKKSLKIFSSKTVCFMKLILCIHVSDISLYKKVVFVPVR